MVREWWIQATSKDLDSCGYIGFRTGDYGTRTFQLKGTVGFCGNFNRYMNGSRATGSPPPPASTISRMLFNPRNTLDTFPTSTLPY